MRFSLVTRFLLLFAAAVVLASCGGHSSATTDNTPASITAAPSSFSMAHGDVAQFSRVGVLNSSNTPIVSPPTVTYASADPSSVTVTSAGIVCAGVFDANNIVCKTTDANGNALPDKTVNITVTSGTASTTVPVFVHTHVDNVKVLGPAVPPACVSQNQTEQFTAQAFSGGQDITSKVGPFTWSTGNSVVATVDQTGVVTSRQPGATTVVASVTNPTGASTTGTPGVVIACPPKSISLHVAGAADTTFSVASGTAETLAADVTDVLGKPITGAILTFSSFMPTVAAITSSGAVTTPGAGVTTLVASCSPPTCNPAAGNFNGTGTGLTVYSNPVVGTVTGTTATTIYVTGSDNPDGSANKSLIPIDSAANTAGTAITLSGSPNSMVFNRAGTTAYIGSSAGLLVFDPGTNTVTGTASGLTGKVLAVSNNGKVVISDTSVSPGSVGKVFVFDTVANASQEFDLAGVTAAAYDSDNSKAYFTSGSAVYEYSPALSERQLSFAADGVVFAPQAAAAFFGGSSISGLAVCNDSALPGAAGVANILTVTPDGSHMIGAGAAGWVDLSYSIANTNGCPPTATNTVRNAAFSFVASPAQVAAASDDSNAFVTGFTGASASTGVPFYHFADGTTGAIALAGSGGPLFSGGLTQDAHSLYVGVGGTTPQVHRIDLTASGGPADANQINVTFNPRIVVVRPK